MKFRNVAVVSLAGTIGAVALGMGGAQAAGSLFGSQDIRDDSIRSLDVQNGTLRVRDMAPTTKDALKGQDGQQGAKGDSGMTGAFYATALYNGGDTNAGAIATVACDVDSSDYTAIAGGAQVLGLDAGANNRNTPVSSSFPGRMDWAANAPKADRLDGWIVQFGGSAGSVAPEKVKLWALCVPNTDIPVQQTFAQVS